MSERIRMTWTPLASRTAPSPAMKGNLGLGTIAATIHPYPTQAEAIRKSGDAYGRTRLTARVAWHFKRWIAWGR